MIVSEGNVARELRDQVLSTLQDKMVESPEAAQRFRAAFPAETCECYGAYVCGIKLTLVRLGELFICSNGLYFSAKLKSKKLVIPFTALRRAEKTRHALLAKTIEITHYSDSSKGEETLLFCNFLHRAETLTVIDDAWQYYVARGIPADKTGNNYAERFYIYASYWEQRPALTVLIHGDGESGKEEPRWLTLSYRQVKESVLSIAASFQANGLQKGDRVCIWYPTSLPFILVDLAAQTLGLITVGLIPGFSLQQVINIVKRVSPRCFMTSQANFDRLIPSDDPASLQTMTAFLQGISPEVEPQLIRIEEFGETGDSLLSIERAGMQLRRQDSALTARLIAGASSLSRSDDSSIFFTSGTTGEPKGAVHTHGSLLSNCDGVISRYFSGSRADTLLLTRFPASQLHHSVMLPLICGGGLMVIGQEGEEDIEGDFIRFQPTLFFTVPEFLSRFMKKVQARASDTPLLGKIIESSVSMGMQTRVAAVEQQHAVGDNQPLSSLVQIYQEERVLGRVRARLGGHLRGIFIAFAKSDANAVKFAWAVGIPVYEMYGSTECNGISCTYSAGICFDTVGTPFPGVNVRLNAENSEIEVSGPTVFRTYWGEPEKTAAKFTADGYYKTGDMGAWVESGGRQYLQVVDRVDDTIKLAHGSLLSPQTIENVLIRQSAVRQACVLPDMPVTENAGLTDAGESLLAILSVDPRICEQRGWQTTDFAELCNKLCSDAGLASYQAIGRYIVSEIEWTPENNLLTSTRKIKRKEIKKFYAAEINQVHPQAL